MIDGHTRRAEEARAARQDFRTLFPRFARCGEELLSRFLHPDFVRLLMKAYCAV